MSETTDGCSADVHTCGKCKEVFLDLAGFFEHKKLHNANITVEEEEELIDNSAHSLAVNGGISEPGRDGVETSPIVQTVMLATDYASRGASYGAPEDNFKIVNDKGETVHLVVVSDKSQYDCTYCNKPFPNALTLKAHVKKSHSDVTNKPVGGFVCRTCNRSCSTDLSLKNHMKTHMKPHSDIKQFVCPYPNCTYSFKTKGSLVRHERRHTDSRPFKCTDCGRTFRESGALNRHRKMQIPCTQKTDSELPNYGKKKPLPGDAPADTESDPIKSDLLSEDMLIGLEKKPTRSPGIIVLSGGRMRAASDEGALLSLGNEEISSVQHEQDTDLETLQEDEAIEGQVIKVSLNIDKGKSLEQELEESEAATPPGEVEHMPLVPETVAEYFTYCQVCRALPSDVASLKQHLREHLSTGAFLCEKCSYIARTRQDLTAHTTHAHAVLSEEPNADLMTSERLYDAKCFDELRTIDPQSVVREAILVVQQLLILDNVSPQESLAQMKNKVLTLKDIKICPVCDKDFRSTSYLKHHMRIHTGERPYKCRVCPKDFPTKDTFKKHLLIHSNERSYKCGECGKLFKRISHAKEHLKVHSDERPYHCNICQKSFKTANIFKVHERTHTQHLPWICKVCNKRFREKASLTRHIRTHTGEKPFQCRYCGKQFGEHGTLARHLRCKVPCTDTLAEARLQETSTDIALEHVTLEESDGVEGVITYPTVLTEFSSVVTDTQEYMPPQEQGVHAGAVDVSQLSTIEIREEGESAGTYIIVNGDLQHLTDFTAEQTVDNHMEITDDGRAMYTEQAGQYILLDNMEEQTLTLEDAHTLTEHH